MYGLSVLHIQGWFLSICVMAENTKTYTIRLKIDGKDIPNSVNDLSTSQKKLRKELKGLEKGTDAYIKKSQQLNQVSKRLDEVKTGVNSVGKAWKQQQSMWTKAKATFAGTFAALSVHGAIQGVQQLGGQIISFVKELSKKRREITRLTDVTGRDLDITAAKIQSIVDTYEKGFDEVLIASNALSKSMGISLTSALEKMQDGFANGADSSGEFLDMLKEYPVQFKAAGLSADQSIALITQQVKEGIYSDKGVDTIKEGTLRLREMTKATREALDAIGISSKQLEADLKSGTISYFDAIQLVSKKLADLEDQSPKVGTAIADIFGGAGEDAGLDYIKMLGTVNLELGKVKTPTSELADANERLALSYQKLADDNGILTRLQIAFKNMAAVLINSVLPGSDRLVDSLIKEQSELNLLVRAIQNSNDDQEIRIGLINELRQSYPDFLGKISDEKVTNDLLAESLKKVNDQYHAKVILQKSEEEMTRIISDQHDNYLSLLAVEKKLADPNLRGRMGMVNRKNELIAERESLAAELEALQKERNILMDEFGSTAEGSNQIQIPSSNTARTPGSRTAREAKDSNPEDQPLLTDFESSEDLILDGFDLTAFEAMLREGKGELFDYLEEVTEEYADKNIDAFDQQMDADALLTDQAISNAEARALAKQEEIALNEQIIEQAMLQGIAAVDGAKTVEEAGKATLNVIRDNIKAHLAEGLAGALKSALIGVPFPFNMIAAAGAGAAASLLFNKVVPSFYDGGYTGRKGIGFGDSDGEFTGMTHKDEYVLSKEKLRDPYVANMVRYVEEGQNYNRSMTGTAASSQTSSTSTSIDASAFNQGVMTFLEAVTVLQQKGIPSYFSRKTFEDATEDQSKKNTAKSRGSLS